jgi:hypothetical protein
MTESIIKAHILQFSEPSSTSSSSRLSSSLKDSRAFLEQIESSLKRFENQLVDLKNNPGDVSLDQATPYALLVNSEYNTMQLKNLLNEQTLQSATE